MEENEKNKKWSNKKPIKIPNEMRFSGIIWIYIYLIIILITKI
jgi:hypothetical protein